MEKVKAILTGLIVVIVILIAIWFIPAFLHEVQGSFQCKQLGDVSVCWSIK